MNLGFRKVTAFLFFSKQIKLYHNIRVAPAAIIIKVMSRVYVPV